MKPWKTIKSESKYKGFRLEVLENTVLDHNDKQFVFTKLMTPDGVTIIPIDSDGNVYLIKQYRYAIDTITIEAPSGGIEEHPNPLETAKSELMEETGFVAKKWDSLGTVNNYSCKTPSVENFFLARELEKHEMNLEPHEQIEPFVVPLEKAVNMVLNGEIVEVATCVAIMRAHKFIQDCNEEYPQTSPSP